MVGDIHVRVLPRKTWVIGIVLDTLTSLSSNTFCFCSNRVGPRVFLEGPRCRNGCCRLPVWRKNTTFFLYQI
jgi:hypothetical protein